MKRWMIGCAAALAIVGCSSAQKKMTQLPMQPSRIAVLPAHNETANVQGGLLLRHLATRYLAQRGYVTIPQSMVDEAMAAQGITDPAQMTPSQLKVLAERTGADTAAVVEVLDFNVANRGFSYERRVSAGLRLIDAASGKTLWQNTESEETKGATRNPTKAVYDYVKQWGTAQYEKATQSPLFPEANSLMEKLLKTLPAYSPV